MLAISQRPEPIIRTQEQLELGARLSRLQETEEYEQWTMKELTLEDKAELDRCVGETAFPVDIWSSNFAYLWSLNRRRRTLRVMRGEVGGMWVTWVLTRKGRLYMPCLPCGTAALDDLVDVLEQCSGFCNRINHETHHTHKASVARLSSTQLDFLSRSERFVNVYQPTRLSGVERHVTIARLLSLSGRRMSTVRHKVNRFKRDHPNARLRPYEARDFDRILELGRRWEQTSGSKHKRILDRFYFKGALRYHQELGLEVLVVESGAEMIGMTCGGLLPTGQAWGFITKFDGRCDGIADYLVVEMAKRIHEISPDAELINLGTDFGSEGLARAKEKFRPVLRNARWALFYRPDSVSERGMETSVAVAR